MDHLYPKNTFEGYKMVQKFIFLISFARRVIDALLTLYLCVNAENAITIMCLFGPEPVSISAGLAFIVSSGKGYTLQPDLMVSQRTSDPYSNLFFCSSNFSFSAGARKRLSNFPARAEPKTRKTCTRRCWFLSSSIRCIFIGNIFR